MIPNSVLNKGKCAILTLFKDTEVFSSGSDKANLFVDIVSENYNLVGF